jgi:hypothetical protein
VYLEIDAHVCWRLEAYCSGFRSFDTKFISQSRVDVERNVVRDKFIECGDGPLILAVIFCDFS